MDAGRYYVRQRGRVRGPFSAEQLRALRDAGQVTLIDQISVDRVTWRPLDQSEATGDASGRQPLVSPPGAVPTSATVPPATPRPTSVAEDVSGSSSAPPCGLLATSCSAGGLMLLALHLPRGWHDGTLVWWWAPATTPGGWPAVWSLGAAVMLALLLLSAPLWQRSRRAALVFVCGLAGVTALTAGVLLVPSAADLLGHVDVSVETLAGRLGVLRAAVAVTLLGTFITLVVCGALAFQRPTSSPVEGRV